MRTTRFMSTSTALGIALAVAVFMTGCAGPSNPSTTATPSTAAASATATSSATGSAPTEPAVRASAIIVGTSGMTVVDSTGTVLEDLAFAAPAADVVRSLTTIFGVSPSESDQPGGLEAFASHVYEWPGFTLFDETRPADKAVWYDYTVLATSENVNGIFVRTPGGVAVGSPESTVVYDPSGRYQMDWGGETCGAESWYSPDGNIDNGLWLYLCSSNDTGLVIRIVSPAQLQV